MATTAAWLILMVGLITGLIIIQHDVDVATRDLKETSRSLISRQVAVKNTECRIEKAVYNNSSGVLTVVLVNSGSEVIPRAEVTLLVDGHLQTTFNITGGRSNKYIYPGESVNITVRLSNAPHRVIAVVSWGVAAMECDIERR
ncbi:MAG: hypothetical protein J7L88_04370 [Thermoplasmata archaeon]|nr:hypothetical protein [Thermoplasmata archaeon]